jgi:hypothetical protein
VYVTGRRAPGSLSPAAPAGVITEFPIPTSQSAPSRITAGPDGTLWFTESTANKIGRITTSGSITEFATPTLEPIQIGRTMLGVQTTHSLRERSGCRMSGKMSPGSGSCMNDQWCGEIGFVDRKRKNIFSSCCRMMRYNGAERIKAIIDTSERRLSGRC